MSHQTNDHLVLIGGSSAAGKSACLMGLANPEGVMYLNCEAGKRLPFRSKFKEFRVTDPLQILEAFTKAEEMPEIHTIVIDTITFLMDMYETQYVLTSANTMKAWGDYATFWKTLMQQYVAKSSKNVIMLAHTMNVMNEADMVMETMVKFKGSIMNQGVEAYFSTVIGCKKLPITKLSDFKSGMLNITPEEEALGYKYVFQTKLTKETVNERIRAPLGMWDTNETYVDNNAQGVLNRLHEYYGTSAAA